jgi:rhodanese-related sulfurtransferase
MCGHGKRATSAASLLATRGFAVRVFDGGPDTWATCTGRALEVGR